MVVPFTAGGPTDALTRILAERMRTRWANRRSRTSPARRGPSGSGASARAPDGYTLSIGQWSTHVVNGAIYTLPFDLIKDLEPVALLPNNQPP